MHEVTRESLEKIISHKKENLDSMVAQAGQIQARLDEAEIYISRLRVEIASLKEDLTSE